MSNIYKIELTYYKVNCQGNSAYFEGDRHDCY